MKWLYRPATSTSFAWNYTKTLIQTGVFWSALLFGLPAVVSAVERRLSFPQFQPQRLAGAVLFVSFGAIALRSAYTLCRVGHGTPLPFDEPSRLVVQGAYRRVRNPMAIAGLVQGLATGLWFGSPGVFVYVAAGGLLWNFVIRPSEERDMADRFGPAFAHYRDTVRCWIPRRTPYEPDRRYEAGHGVPPRQ